MKFRIETACLQRIIKLLGVTAKVNTNDVSGRILIKAEENKISFFSNNNSTAMSIEADKFFVEEPGSKSILFSKIKTFVSSFSPWNDDHGAKEFVFTGKDRNLTITVENIYESGKKSKGKLILDIFPDVPSPQFKPFGEPTFILNSNIFKTATNKVLYAIDPNEMRKFIQGMCIKFSKDNIYFAGTNGLMLSEYEIKNISTIEDGEFVLKYDFIMGLRRALGEDTQVSFELDKNIMKAKFEDVMFWGKTVIGHPYPEYKPNLENYKYTLTINKDVFMSNLVPFVDVLNPDDNNRLSMSIKDKKITLYNDHAEFIYDDDISFEEEFVIDVNGNFMRQTVDAIKDDMVTLKFSDSNGVLIFDSSNFKDQKALITPIRRR